MKLNIIYHSFFSSSAPALASFYSFSCSLSHFWYFCSCEFYVFLNLFTMASGRALSLASWVGRPVSGSNLLYLSVSNVVNQSLPGVDFFLSSNSLRCLFSSSLAAFSASLVSLSFISFSLSSYFQMLSWSLPLSSSLMPR
jgi:hypothetical protein